MFRTEEQTLAVAHLWAVEIYYEGIQAECGLFATKELAEAFIEGNEWYSGQSVAVPMALPTKVGA